MKHITCSAFTIALCCGLLHGAQNTGDSSRQQPTTLQQQATDQKGKQKDKDATKLEGQESGVRCSRLRKKG